MSCIMVTPPGGKLNVRIIIVANFKSTSTAAQAASDFTQAVTDAVNKYCTVANMVNNLQIPVKPATAAKKKSAAKK